jgi:ribosomal protein L34E
MSNNELPEVATCRGCGKVLKGRPVYTGQAVYHPDTNERCKVNFYGGHVCSPECDRRSSLELERTMPGHTANQSSLSCQALADWKKNWQ